MLFSFVHTHSQNRDHNDFDGFLYFFVGFLIDRKRVCVYDAIIILFCYRRVFRNDFEKINIHTSYVTVVPNVII